MSSPTDSQILKWLSPSGYELIQAELISRVGEGTGQWFLESAEFTTWVLDSNQMLLFTGAAGSGKTMMTAIVVDTLRQRFHGDSTIGIAFLYCDFSHQNKQQPERLYAELLQQLGKQSLILPKVLKRMYGEFIANGPSFQPPTSAYVEALAATVSLFSRVLVLVDGLDELATSAREVFLRQLTDLQKTCQFNLFATSRLEAGVEQHFENAIIFNARSSDEDIGKFVDRGLSDRLQQIIRVAPQLQGQIREAIVQKSNGMYVLQCKC